MDEPIGNGNASAFWYKPVIQFGFGVIEYTTSGFALGRVYSITPHPHCITYTEKIVLINMDKAMQWWRVWIRNMSGERELVEVSIA